MGLDMYLSAKRYLSQYTYNDEAASEKKLGEAIAKLISPFVGTSVSEITTRVAYWRKANQIHNWFVVNVQDGVDECQEAYLSIEALRELYELCNRILGLEADGLTEELEAAIENELPPTSGFFFGSTEIDDYYFEELRSTVEQLEPIVNLSEETLSEWSIYYQSSW